MERTAVIHRDAAVARVGVAFGVNRAERLDLRHALQRRIVFEVCRDDAYVAERRRNDRFERNARHSRNAWIARKRQQMPINLFHRIARQDHVAEMAATTIFCRLVDGDPWYGRVPGQ